MLYEQYANKIRRYAQIRDNILRFKILIICVLAAILAALTGFLITKGIITEQISGNDEYTYGQNFSFEAKALFSKVTYEYFDGAEWSEQAPTLAGEYQVRAVSSRSFGRNGYSESFAFVITPRSVTLSVVGNTLEWRELPEIEADGLARGDTLDSVGVALPDGELGEKQALIDTQSVVILNSKGENVSSSYAPVVGKTDLTVVPRALSLSIKSVSKEYDGKALTHGGYTVTSGELIDGHTVDMSIEMPAIVDVGSCKISSNGVKITENGVDITDKYSVSVAAGKGEITKRRITVSSPDVSKVYDGEALMPPEWKLSAEAADGEALTVYTYEGDLIKPQSVKYITGCTVTRGGEDASRNYDISINSGMLTVEKRNLTVRTDSLSKTYDGTPLETGSSYSFDGLAATDSVILSGSSALTDAGSAQNSVRVEIYNGSEHVNDCYNITTAFGTLTVKPRKLTIISESAEKIYDGTPLYAYFSLGGDGVVDNDHLSVSGGSLTDVGSMTNELTYGIRGKYDNADKLHNYEITTDWGTLTVKPRPITLQTPTASKYYDGSLLEARRVDVVGGSLAEGEQIYINSWEEITDVLRDGTGKVISQQNVIGINIRNSVEYKDTIENYDITWEYGTLTVLPLTLNIEVYDISRIYNGSTIYGLTRGTNYNYSVYAGTDTASIIGSMTARLNERHSGEVTDTPTPFTVDLLLRYGGEDVSGNYDISISYENGDCGYITVTPIEIEIILKDKEVLYNGKRVLLLTADYSMSIISGTGIPDSYTVDILGDFINANGEGEQYTVVFDVGERARNYRVTVIGTNGEYSTLKILKRNFCYQTPSQSFEYDGTNHNNTDLVMEPCDGLADGHGYYVEDKDIPIIRDVLYVGGAVSGIANDFPFKIYDADGNDVTANYDIQCKGIGTLTVYPRAVTVISASDSKVYDGSPLKADSIEWSDRILSGHQIRIITYPTMTNVLRNPTNKSIVLSKENKITIEIGYYDGDTWVDLTANYCLGDKGYGGSFTYGTLKIEPRYLAITSASGTWTYDRQAHSAQSYTVTPFGSSVGIIGGQYLEDSSIILNVYKTGVGTKANIILFALGCDIYTGLIFDGTGEDMTANYDIQLFEGTLTVNPIDIVIAPSYVGLEYDAKWHTATTYKTSGELLDGDIGLKYVKLGGGGENAGKHASTVLVAVIFDEYGVGILRNGAMYHYVFIDPSLPMYISVSGGYLEIYADGTVNELSRRPSGVSSNYTRGYIDLDGETSRLCCYNIQAEQGTVNIRPRKITITCESKTEKYYAGKILSSSKSHVTNGTAAEGHKISAPAFGNATQQGVAVESTVDMSDIVIQDINDNNITQEVIGNYEIKIVSGWLLME